MPLNASSPAYLHLLQNLVLIAISLFFAPLCTFITICSHIVSPYTNPAKRIQHKREGRSLTSSTFRPRTILVTGVGMSKGLSIARAFYREGHDVIGADFEPFGVPVCGRFSAALTKFYKLSKPVPGMDDSRAYVNELLKLIQRERVELWVSCSGVASAIEDADAALAIETQSSCKVIQFGAETTKTLHEKHSFIQQAYGFGLNVPETHIITSINDTIAQLHANKTETRERQFIMKSIGLDDSIRADMTILPRPSPSDTRGYLKRLNPNSTRPFVLQQFVRGPEYCTHAIVIRGHVVAFTACPSAELLMHYKALSPTSELSVVMQKYTQVYAGKLGNVTGHFSIDFILDEDDLRSELANRLYPIECNPRAHTAVVLLENESVGMVDAYLGVLENATSYSAALQHTVVPSNTTGYYWIGHDIVALVLLPFLSTITLRTDLLGVLKSWRDFLEHIACWKDGTYEIWDAWPFWWLYCVYWPGMFLSVILTRNWWSRCNVSTTKIFRC